MEKVPSKQEQKDNISLILWAQELATQETAKQIFKLLDHEIYVGRYKDKKLTIEFTDYEKIKAKFLQERMK